MILKIIVLIQSFNSISCVFKYFSENPNVSPFSGGLLSDNDFFYTPRSTMDGSFPSQIQVQANILGTTLDVTLYEQQGVIKTSSLNSRVYIQNGVDINEMESESLKYSLYYDEANTVFATLIDNSDLIDRGIDTNGYVFRILLSTNINSTQVNFEAAILTISTQQTYEHYYTVKVIAAGSDIDDKYVNSTITTCDPSTCQNSGTCSIGFAGSNYCLCPQFFTGTFCETDTRLITLTTTTITLCDQCNIQTKVTRPTDKTLCNPNPCMNGGFCRISSKKEFYTCFCPSDFTGPTCNINVNELDNSSNNYGRALNNNIKVSQTGKKQKRNTSRSKRSNSDGQHDLFINYLVVIDRSVYNVFIAQYGNLPYSLITNYIKIFFCNVINGVNQRFYNSLVNDPDLMLTISLANVLIINDDSLTPWTNTSLVGVPGWSSYLNSSAYLPAILSNASVTSFADSINKMALDLTYDYAVAVMNYDIWNQFDYLANNVRRATLAYSMSIPGICSTEKYSILEFNGFNAIQNSAHELGHILGAVHDGTIYNNIDARACLASANNIMTPSVGAFSNANAMFFFSSCSIDSFKSTLLSPDMQSLSEHGSCLSDAIGTLTAEFKSVYGNETLPGQFYSVDQQCQLIYGTISHYCNGTYIRGSYIQNNDLTICSYLKCYTGVIENGACLTGGNGYAGIGALEGTSCYSYDSDGRLIPEMICYQGRCVNRTTVPLAQCVPNPCQNGGKCVTSNSLNSGFSCNCQNGFTGLECEYLETTTASLTVVSTTAIMITTTTHKNGCKHA